ncbi:MAG: hypothetical protein UIM53_02940 [Acutalibacteraceae bacterium]|nr:hypothetical protein [Acutalibacteraceae bacterium]
MKKNLTTKKNINVNIDNKIIDVNLPKEFTSAEVHIFADLHIGDPLCDIQEIKNRIKAVESKDNALAILNGDILNNAIASSVSDCYAEKLTPMEQVEKAAELFAPIKDKIIAITNGNHEDRTYKQTGIDLTQVLALKLGLQEKFSPSAATIIIRLGNGNRQRKIWYSMYVTHGRGGGSKPGSKVNKLAELKSIIDTDIYVHSHTHMPAIFKEGFERLDVINRSIQVVEKLFINTSSELNYGGYGQVACFTPSAKATPVIHLSGTEKKYYATL